jgi:hypothetical protein
MSIEKVRNLIANARIASKDANAPPEHVSAQRRFDAAYDCGHACSLAVLECMKLELEGKGHHREAFDFFFKTTGVKGKTASDTPGMVGARNAIRNDAASMVDEAFVTHGMAWAQRILAETENWLERHQPSALK